MNEPASEFIGIGGLVKELGVGRSTIRFWEARGVIPPATRLEPGARRMWRREDVPSISEMAAARKRRLGCRAA